MKAFNQPHQLLKKTLVLGLALSLTAGTAVIAKSPLHAAAASATASGTVNASVAASIYKQFEKYVSKPATLAKARAYLINNINRVSKTQATIMTLHLENAQLAHLPAFSEKLYPQNIQKEIDKAYRKKGISLDALIGATTDAKTKALLIEARDKGYKLETSEGMYYPVMHYQSFKQFQSHINKDIASYIDLMAVASNSPVAFDGAIVIGWDELISRTVALETFLKQYPKSNRATVIKEHFQLLKSRTFYGASNTPVYDSFGPKGETAINPKVRAAYEAAVKKGNGGSVFLSSIQSLLKLLDGSNNLQTAEINRFLEKQVQ
ncbi:hypothetical protein [Paenibacillus gorillae]|uniref:hypothetical protein n=1 Tax=Paenibacillus gorillae TaxID=1243662 RepID=UPI0004B78679|nr:hypothetical protein [Paenibacillus gorillae]